MITISLDQPSAQYRPGETISGSVSWPQLTEEIDGLEIRLLWYTEGKGSQDIEVVAVEKSEAPRSAGSIRFQFVAPTRPFSFSGKLISLAWTLEVVLLPTGEGFREPIVLSGDGREIQLAQSFDNVALKPAVKVSK